MSNNASYVLAQKEQLLSGDSQAIEEQKSAGKRYARERVLDILDDGTFVEVDVFLKSRKTELAGEVPCEGLVAGFGTIDQRPVYIFSQDFTVLSGSVGEANANKIAKVMTMAADNGVPVVGIWDSAGARVGEGVYALEAFGKIFSISSQIKGIVPQVSIIAGPCVGANAIAARISDVVLAVDEITEMGAFGKATYDAKLGNADGSDICSAAYASTTSGLVDAVYATEAECTEGLKEVLDYLWDTSADATDDLNREIPEFDNFLEGGFDVCDVITSLADDNKAFFAGKDYAKTMVTGFIKVNGNTIGVVANQANENDAAMKVDGIVKACDFVDKCDSLGFPILTLVDNKGLCACPENEANGVVLKSSKLVQAYANATVPKIALILNNAIGSGYAMMASKALGTDMVYSWPNAVISTMDPMAAAQIAYGKEIASSENPVAARSEYATKFVQYDATPINAASSGLIDDIIDPISTRPILAAAFEMLLFATKF